MTNYTRGPSLQIVMLHWSFVIGHLSFLKTVTVFMKTTAKETRVRIGNQSAFSAAALSDPFEYGIQNSFDAFEWFPDKRASGAGWDASEIGEETRRHIRNAARDRDIRLSVHAPWHANPLQPEGYDTLLADLGFADEIGAGVLNI